MQCILERHTSSLLAQVEQQGDRVMAVPLDDRLLTTVELLAGDRIHLDPEQQTVVEVRIDRFPVAQFEPLGHVVRSLPVHGGPAADRDLLLTKHHLHDRPAAPRTTLKTPLAKGREDLTHLPTLLLEAWQSPEAPGFPALSLEEREGGWRLWVHAPAVAERISLAGGLDTWLRRQAEAVCVGDRWLPLLTASLAKASGFGTGESRPPFRWPWNSTPRGSWSISASASARSHPPAGWMPLPSKPWRPASPGPAP